MKCSHCLVAFSPEMSYTGAWFDHTWKMQSNPPSRIGQRVAYTLCPECHRPNIFLEYGTLIDVGEEFGEVTGHTLYNVLGEELLYPKAEVREVPVEVPVRFADDFKEACSVLQLSPKASAAICRRLLQDVLRGHFGITRRDLSLEIEEFIGRPDTPSHLAHAVDAIRTVGNFAAHPLKDQNTGSVVDVEPGEADWLLDVLESLFDYAFVQPERLKRQRDALNAKLLAMGKPPMKTPGSTP